MSRAGRGLKNKKAKHSTGGGFPAQQNPGLPRGVHAPPRKPSDLPCRCGRCNAEAAGA